MTNADAATVADDVFSICYYFTTAFIQEYWKMETSIPKYTKMNNYIFKPDRSRYVNACGIFMDETFKLKSSLAAIDILPELTEVCSLKEMTMLCLNDFYLLLDARKTLFRKLNIHIPKRSYTWNAYNRDFKIAQSRQYSFRYLLSNLETLYIRTYNSFYKKEE